MCILSDHHQLRLDFNNNKTTENSWKLNNSLLNDNVVREEIKKLEISDTSNLTVQLKALEKTKKQTYPGGVDSRK